MHWDVMNAIWALQGEPLRPPPQVVETVVSEVATQGCSNTLLLGVTPEYHGRFQKLTSIDGSESMIKAVWPGNTEKDRVIFGDWLAINKKVSEADSVIGDFSLGVIGGKNNVKELLASIRNVCVEGGVCLFRTWVQPDACITNTDILEYCKSSTFSSHALRLRIGMLLAQKNDGAVPVSLIRETFNDIFPCRETFFNETKINPDELKLIDLYQSSESVYYYPHKDELADMIVGAGFSHEFLEVGGYDFSSECPVVRMAG
ncbi:hypothetical protein [Phaeobacter gallaeciensis]|uniref:hypothetical protein n=1 Tax=Phaeobacter gallaeciensis TaxID=60890 RepID=UPI00237F6605|nr:hypothetical protein [Phaeobacter gallaeciensis]MDE4063642.1 hypothetical protein [Phaeobacter gallaeciensis]MDE4126652.1 hypothetical protein [Phaeobacter gallaeciensis]MDE4131138.1 hypothetical protein [Phaeobacter gallaeciensis]